MGRWTTISTLVLHNNPQACNQPYSICPSLQIRGYNFNWTRCTFSSSDLLQLQNERGTSVGVTRYDQWEAWWSWRKSGRAPKTNCPIFTTPRSKTGPLYLTISFSSGSSRASWTWARAGKVRMRSNISLKMEHSIWQLLTGFHFIDHGMWSTYDAISFEILLSKYLIDADVIRQNLSSPVNIKWNDFLNLWLCPHLPINCELWLTWMNMHIHDAVVQTPKNWCQPNFYGPCRALEVRSTLASKNRRLLAPSTLY